MLLIEIPRKKDFKVDVDLYHSKIQKKRFKQELLKQHVWNTKKETLCLLRESITIRDVK